jgi:hypothetical protein
MCRKVTQVRKVSCLLVAKSVRLIDVFDSSGVIFREEEGQKRSPQRTFKEDDESDEEGANNTSTETRLWGVQSTFANFTAWTRRAEPSHQDKTMKWMEWTKMAEAVHAPVTKEALEAPIKYKVEKAPKPAADTETPASEPTTPTKKAKLHEDEDGSENKDHVIEDASGTPTKPDAVEGSMNGTSEVKDDLSDDDDIDTVKTKRTKRKQAT